MSSASRVVSSPAAGLLTNFFLSCCRWTIGHFCTLFSHWLASSPCLAFLLTAHWLSARHRCPNDTDIEEEKEEEEEEEGVANNSPKSVSVCVPIAISDFQTDLRR